MWQVIRSILPKTEGPLRAISHRYQATRCIVDDERAKYCTDQTLMLLEDSVAAMFIEEKFNSSVVDQVYCQCFTCTYLCCLYIFIYCYIRQKFSGNVLMSKGYQQYKSS